MSMTKEIRFRLPRLFCFILCLGLSSTLPVFSQYSFKNHDTTGNALLAAVEKRITQEVVIKESNVEFPQILKGNEEEAADYVAKFSERRRDYLVRMYSKGKKLLPKAAGILKKYSLPEELKVLMILESAYNANAVSKAGAVGYWQFMDVVAKEYGLRYVPQQKKEEKIIAKKGKKKSKRESAEKKDIAKHKTRGKEIDDRKNFNKATIAAARYLRDRKVNLDGNWLLVVASYNCGVGNVWKAMEKCKAANPCFWDIKKYLPAETQAYVMNFIALNVVYSNYDKFLKNNLIFTPVKAEQPCDTFEDNISEELAGIKPASK
ncbi:MAG: lytic transglycosylase domain-containing protein [Chitinophagaceae bacterium]|nr:lytic transglycosylase domain-containing protein [Chitinophagaceae bacterium]